MALRFARNWLKFVRSDLPADWKFLRMMALERDGWQCVQCGSRARLEVDHKRRIVDGGSHALENLQTLCRHCHITKTKAENAVSTIKGQRDWERVMARKGRNRFARV